MKRYITYNTALFNDIVAELVSNCDIRELRTNYIQTDCLIHVTDLGHNVLEHPNFDEEGSEITPAIFSDYIMIDIMGDYTHPDLIEVFPATPNHRYS